MGWSAGVLEHSSTKWVQVRALTCGEAIKGSILRLERRNGQQTGRPVGTQGHGSVHDGTGRKHLSPSRAQRLRLGHRESLGEPSALGLVPTSASRDHYRPCPGAKPRAELVCDGRGEGCRGVGRAASGTENGL